MFNIGKNTNRGKNYFTLSCLAKRTQIFTVKATITIKISNFYSELLTLHPHILNSRVRNGLVLSTFPPISFLKKKLSPETQEEDEKLFITIYITRKGERGLVVKVTKTLNSKCSF